MQLGAPRFPERPDGPGDSRPTYRRPRRPSSPTLCAANDPLFLDPVPRRRRIAYKIEASVAAIRVKEEDPVNCGWVIRESRRIRRNRGRSTTDPADPLSGPFARLGIHYFWGHFRAAVGSTKNVPKLRRPPCDAIGVLKEGRLGRR